MHQIKDLILKTEKVKWQDLKDLQPTNLKTPYHSEATKKSLIKNGFSFPFAVWENKQGQIFLVDGHLRTDLLRELQNEGVEVPEELTCNYLDLPDRKTAVRHLLEVYNTKKNPIDETAMITWIKDEDLELEDVDIEWVDVQLEVKNTEDPDLDFDNIESTENRSKQFKTQNVTCPSCDNHFQIQI